MRVFFFFQLFNHKFRRAVKNKIQFYVYVEHRPIVESDMVDGEKIYGEIQNEKNFTGAERHKALKYAKELAEKYQCKIEKQGYWGKW